MRQLLLKSTLALAVAAALIFALVWWDFSSPDRVISKNPVMSTISEAGSPWETRISLIGSVFDLNETRSTVEDTLRGAGFSEDLDFKFYFADDSVSSEGLIWSANQSSSVCNMEWSVITEFDESNRLLAADGLVSERGCL